MAPCPKWGMEVTYDDLEIGLNAAASAVYPIIRLLCTDLMVNEHDETARLLILMKHVYEICAFF